MLVDLPLDKLKKYKPRKTKEEDFDKFWDETIKISKSQTLNENIEKINYIVDDINVYKASYDGFNGARIYGHYLTPKNKSNIPSILVFHGYSGSKGPINLYLKWVLLGYAVFAIDVRGQTGESIDNKSYPPPSTVGYMTKGILNKEEYYYRGVYMDCIRAIDFLSKREEIDISRLCVMGISQGGGLTLTTAALDSRPKLALAEIPYLCHFKRAVEWAEEAKNLVYLEIPNIIREYPEKEKQIFKTLSYFDNLNLCERIKARTIITCAMEDIVCPPSTVFAVYNHIKSDKKIEILPYTEHGYQAVYAFEEKRLHYIKKYL